MLKETMLAAAVITGSAFFAKGGQPISTKTIIAGKFNDIP